MTMVLSFEFNFSGRIRKNIFRFHSKCQPCNVTNQFGAQIDTLVVFILCMILQYLLFVSLLFCFFLQTLHAIRRKSFTRMENETYIHDGSDLGTGEKDVGLFTYLTIGWITPLMNRGQCGQYCPIELLWGQF